LSALIEIVSGRQKLCVICKGSVWNNWQRKREWELDNLGSPGKDH